MFLQITISDKNFYTYITLQTEIKLNYVTIPMQRNDCLKAGAIFLNVLTAEGT